MEHLITSIGLNDYSELNYCAGGKNYRTAFAPVAVARLTGLSGARASVLVTGKAREKNYEKLAAELRAAGLYPEPVDIPDGVCEEDILKILDIITSLVGEGDSIVLDVTFSLRHLPFIYLAALIYLAGLKQVKLRGIYYGAYDLKQGEDAPILDITYLYRLIEWYYGLTTARQEGDFRPMGRLLRGDVGRLFSQGVKDGNLSYVSRLAQGLAFGLASVLPLEVGLRSGEILSLLGEVRESSDPALTSRLALDYLGRALGGWQVACSSGGGKEGIQLSQDELRRQLQLADWYISSMNLPAALLALREWMISRLQLAAGQRSGWLGYNNRKPYEKALNAVSERARHGLGTAIEKDLAASWGKISRMRNQLAHAGMDTPEVIVSLDEVKNALKECRRLLAADLPARVPEQGGGVCLVTPLGLSRGVLYSALTLVKPDCLVVVTSRESCQAIPEILGKAGFSRLDPLVIELKDPHHGFFEAGKAAAERQELIMALAAAGKVVVNITGGTTAMQFAAERLSDLAARLGTPLARVALIDRRPYPEQQQKPYVCGEIVTLSDEE